MFGRTVARRVLGVLTLAVLLGAYASVAHGQDSGPTDEIADCIDAAWDRHVECLDDLPWWAEVLCAFRLNSDIVLCLPKEILAF